MSSGKLPATINKNIFLYDVEFFGMDNFYIGNADTIYKMAAIFNSNLDSIVEKYVNVTSHEFYTFHINNKLMLQHTPNKPENFVIEPTDTLPFKKGDSINVKNKNKPESQVKRSTPAPATPHVSMEKSNRSASMALNLESNPIEIKDSPVLDPTTNKTLTLSQFNKPKSLLGMISLDDNDKPSINNENIKASTLPSFNNAGISIPFQFDSPENKSSLYQNSGESFTTPLLSSFNNKGGSEPFQFDTPVNQIFILSFVQNPEGLYMMSEVWESEQRYDRAIREMRLAIGLLEAQNADVSVLQRYKDRLTLLSSKK
jgi:hypothetical protein